MNSYYMEPEMGATFAGAGVGLVFLILYLVIIFGSMLLAIASYVMSSLGMYTIAKRRGIQNPWLAWIPVGNAWILGSISDQYQYVAKGKIRNRRKLLAGLEIGLYVSLILFFALYCIFIFAMVGTGGELPAFGIILALAFILLSMAMLAVSIVYMVFAYMSYYDLFYSCNPDNAVLFLVLSIFISYALPVTLFIDRKKDLGMPPVKETVEEAVPEVLDAPEE